MHKHVEQAPQPLRELRTEVPGAVEQLVLDLLAKEPEQRPADALAVHQRLLPFLPQPGSGSTPTPALMDPTRPYRFPLDPRRCLAVRPPAEVTPQVPADVEGARRHAQRLIHEGRFTQARGPVDEIVLHCRNQAAICSAEIGDVTTALQGFRSLFADLQPVLGADDDQVLELRRQIGLLEASSGAVSAARRTLGTLERDLRRLLGPQHPDVLELGALLQHLRKMGARRR